MSATLAEVLADPPHGSAGNGQRRHARPGKAGPFSTLVGLVGELLVTLGVLLGLFVVWQLWWTDVEAMQAQAELLSQVEESFVPSPEVPGEVRTDDPPVMEPAGIAEQFGNLWVPRWDDGDSPYVRTLSEGTDRATVLDPLGIGRYTDSQMPGEVGNFALAGHRQSHGKPFYAVTELEDGDSLIVETAEAWYVYRVTTTRIVLPTEVSVVGPNPIDPGAQATDRMITLTTCHPLFSTRERFIVHGVLDHWVPRDSGRPAELITGEGA